MTGLTRGSMGLHPPGLFSTTSNLPYYYVILAMLCSSTSPCAWSPSRPSAWRSRPSARTSRPPRASGINPTRYRVFNFTLSCVFAGLLGGFYAHYYGSSRPRRHAHVEDRGGARCRLHRRTRQPVGRPSSPSPSCSSSNTCAPVSPIFPGCSSVIYGIVMIIVMIYYPAGFSGVYYWAEAKVRAMFSRRRGRSGRRQRTG